MLTSQLCTHASLTSPELRVWSDRLRPMWDPAGDDPRPVMLHRKMWEWLFICQALSERDMLRPGRRGLGFGVGREPLVPLFAALGCEIVATDLEPDRAQEAGWTATGDEYSGGLVSAPVFQKVMSYGLQEQGIAPTGTASPDLPVTW